MIPKYINGFLPAIVYVTEKSLFNLVGSPISELHRVQIVFAEAIRCTPMQQSPSLIGFCATDDGIWLEVKIVVFRLVRLKKSPLIPLGDIVVYMSLRVHAETAW